MICDIKFCMSYVCRVQHQKPIKTFHNFIFQDRKVSQYWTVKVKDGCDDHCAPKFSSNWKKINTLIRMTARFLIIFLSHLNIAESPHLLFPSCLSKDNTNKTLENKGDGVKFVNTPSPRISPSKLLNETSMALRYKVFPMT